MEWSNMGNDYLTVLEAVSYWGIISLWIIAPFVAITVAVIYGCRALNNWAIRKHSQREVDKAFNDIVRTL